MTETPSQAVRQMSYYEPLFKGLSIDENSSIAMMALLDSARRARCQSVGRDGFPDQKL